MRFSALLICSILFAGNVWAGSAQPLKTEKVLLSYKNTHHVFEAEIAQTQAERQKGLMHRTNLPQAMLFVFPAPQKITMWMKNTPQSLDMIFIHNNVVINVEENTIPFSEELIASAGKADMVLEVPAGTAAQKQITQGWRFSYATKK